MMYGNYPPTPIQMLTDRFNGNAFFVKRDDLFPFSFGGNKARKAMLFFAEVERKSCDYVVTYGSSSSNHCRVVANLAAAKGLPCSIISPVETRTASYNTALMQFFGAEIILCQVAAVKDTIEEKLERLRHQGYKPYFIPGGGHGNLGTKAYADAYKEILHFENSNKIKFDYIFHPSGTGTTQAGLVCGQVINKDNSKVVGISIARRKPWGSQVVVDSVNSYLNSIGETGVSGESIDFVDAYVLEGYGSYNQEVVQTIRSVLIKEGIPLDTTYTGKAFWGMKEFIRESQITGMNILFIHTGGTPLFFDSLGEL